ncbi:MAG: HNH endonuclease [Candidatus Glassbacteria bacterium]|nr:HNH endonuclease [Candidatus Glassbacteria bacterium]
MLNNSVLVLNSSFQPLHVCQARRALVLVMGGKAEVLEYYDHLYVRSVAQRFRLPSVVRLMRYISTDRRAINLNRRNILRRDGHRCQYCGTTRLPLTTDHVVPRSMGGEDTWENLVTACVNCNNKKANRTPQRAGMRLLSRPKRPHYFSFIYFYHSQSVKNWRRYLFLE